MTSGDREPYLERIKHGLQRERAAQAEDAPFSPLELRDRVVVMLLFNQVVRIEQVERAWTAWQQDRQGEAFWRVLAADPEVDREAVFAEAARVYGFERADVSTYRALGFIRKHRSAFSQEQWRRMAGLAVLPAALEHGAQGADPQWVFITHDPTRPAVSRLLSDLGLRRYVVRYLPEPTLRELLAEAFPTWAEAARSRAREAQISPHAPRSSEEEQRAEEPAAEEEASTLLNLFEDILVQMVQERADAAHLQPGEEQALEVRFRRGKEQRLRRVEERVPAAAFMAFLKEDVLERNRLDQAERTEKTLQRWIDGERARFRLILHRSEDDRGRRAESVVIRRLER